MRARSSSRVKAHRFGLRAESWAAWFLRLKGYRVLAVRYRNKLGEIDLVARRGSVLALVEVKARTHADACIESVNAAKQQRIARAAQGLLSHPGKIAGLGDPSRLTVRFDVVAVMPRRLPLHLINAWQL